MTATTLSPTMDPLVEFWKGIKWDPSAYPILKDINQWDLWKRIFVATAEAQGIQNILNIGYSLPRHEKPLFLEQQKYVYSVLLNMVKASTLKSIVINAKKDSIPQCWDTIMQAAECLTSAKIKATDLLQYITSAKYDDGKWRGTSKDFIIHWCEQLQQYKDLCCDGANQFSDVAKTQMLQNTLDNVIEFQMICTTAQQTGHAVNGGKPHSYEDYKALVISAADAYNTRLAAKRHPIRNTFLHNLTDNDSVVDHYDNGYDINTMIDIIYVNTVKTRAGMIPNEHF